MILAAGYGTRLLPLTKSQPKEMLPLVDRPIIHYSVEEAVRSGIEQIIIVTAIGKRAVEDYFDRSRDIEALLQAKGDEETLKQVMAVSDMANIAYVRQGEAKGLGHAVMTARHLVEDEPFILILPDDVMIGEPPATQQLIDAYDQYGASIVCVDEVPDHEVSSYGIVAGTPVSEHVTKLSHMVEKPKVGEHPSNLAIVGRYLLTPAVFDAIEKTEPGYGGEIQITDALQKLADTEGMYAHRFDGERYDTGRPLALLVASIAMGLKRPDIAPRLRDYLRSLDLNEE
ncbi:MAG: UTP--glucose-1-phosphate uridylyltransferase GalU [Dehalococcoidia bacterium]